MFRPLRRLAGCVALLQVGQFGPRSGDVFPGFSSFRTLRLYCEHLRNNRMGVAVPVIRPLPVHPGLPSPRSALRYRQRPVSASMLRLRPRGPLGMALRFPRGGCQRQNMSSSGNRGPGWDYRVLAVEAWERGVASRDSLVRRSWERIAIAYHERAERLDRDFKL